MESQPSGQIPPAAAREQLRAARLAHDASVRRAMTPAWCILALSVFCGALTVAPAYKGGGHVALIVVAMSMLVLAVVMSARKQWRSWPRPNWGVAEVTFISVAVLAFAGGDRLSDHIANHGNPALASWGLGGAVTVIVATCLFAWNASYRRGAARRWQR